MKVTLYTTHCPKCNVLKTKLEESNIEYEEIDDADVMIEKGFLQAPMLDVDGETMDFVSAVKYVNSLIKEDTPAPNDFVCEGCSL